jgi:hypothetical protein
MLLACLGRCSPARRHGPMASRIFHCRGQFAQTKHENQMAKYLDMLYTTDGEHFVIRNPWLCVTFPTGEVSTLQISLCWERLCVGHAGAGMGRDTKGPSQRNNCPTL